MKKNLLPLLMIVFIFKTMAQPQLTPTILPVNGDTILLTVDTVLRSPGPAGAGMSWDFTSLKANFVTKRLYVLPSSTPYASMFPSATLTRKDVNGYYYAYWKNNATSSTYFGFVQPGIVDQNYNTLPITYYKFPIKYNDTFTSSFTATTNPGSLVGPGKYSFKADGWGVLKLPKIIVTNTLRTKSVLYIGDSTINSYSLTTEYAWYVNGQKDPLLVISSVVVNHQLTEKVILYYNSPLLAVDLIKTKDFINLFPNPASKSLEISLDKNKFYGEAQIKVFDATGKIQHLNTIKTSDANYVLDVSGFHSGYYILEVMANDQIYHQTFLKE